jgi:hypothetical protein
VLSTALYKTNREFIVKRYLIPVVFCLIATAASANTWETSSFRTNNGQMVRVGMTKAEVRRDAGAPLDKEKAGRAKDDKRRDKGEVWTYKGNDGIYSIRFSGDKVASIDVAPFRGR